MKVTKYPQSCLLIEEGDTRILVDPGTIFSDKYDIDDVGQLDAVFYTHQHADHFDPSLVSNFTDMGAEIYGNASVCSLIDEGAHTIEDGQSVEVGSITAVAHDLPHCPMADGAPGPENTGFVFNNLLFHPGDGIEILGVTVENIAAPIAGPSISLKDAFDLAREVAAKQVIPIHYDYFYENLEVVQKQGESMDFNVLILENGESTEL